MKRMLDLFCGRLGWSKAFLARGWEVVGVDIVESPLSWDDAVKFKYSCRFDFIKRDVLRIGNPDDLANYIHLPNFNFICASSPCEEFSVHGMKHFHPNPKYPFNGIRLFNHTREICEAADVPYVMENVRAAQQFVGRAVHHCGPFYLWGTGVPSKEQLGLFGESSHIPNDLPRGIVKGLRIGSGAQMRRLPREEVRAWRKQYAALQASSRGPERASMTAKWATIPPELANCVADYAERLLETSHEQTTGVPGRLTR